MIQAELRRLLSFIKWKKEKLWREQNVYHKRGLKKRNQKSHMKASRGAYKKASAFKRTGADTFRRQKQGGAEQQEKSKQRFAYLMKTAGSNPASCYSAETGQGLRQKAASRNLKKLPDCTEKNHKNICIKFRLKEI